LPGARARALSKEANFFVVFYSIFTNTTYKRYIYHIYDITNII
jgi:hypothetical protein